MLQGNKHTEIKIRFPIPAVNQDCSNPDINSYPEMGYCMICPLLACLHRGDIQRKNIYTDVIKRYL